VETSGWRIRVECAKATPAELLAAIAQTAGDHPPKHADVGSTSFYPDGETAARAAFAQAREQAAFSYALLERWDSDAEEWTSVQHAGADPAPTITRRQWRQAARYAGLNLLGGLLLYFVPGAEYAPGAGHLHDLASTFGIMALVNAIAGGYCLFMRRPSRRSSLR
jgi:hypothetical protein